ncbi:MAG: acyltransferase [Polyangiales bacterium]
MTVGEDRDARLRAQHQKRMEHMPYLYFRAPPSIRAWAAEWQREVHAALVAVENVVIDESAFVAPSARIFAEPHRAVRIGRGASIAADCFVHGPVVLGDGASLNPRVTIDGGRAGVVVGARTRIASGVAIYAFDHGIAPDRPVMDQPVRSLGIRLGDDVWIGANAGITDGVTIADHAVVGMGAVVTRDVPAWAIVAGVPARVIGDRRKGLGG